MYKEIDLDAGRKVSFSAKGNNFDDVNRKEDRKDSMMELRKDKNEESNTKVDEIMRTDIKTTGITGRIPTGKDNDEKCTFSEHRLFPLCAENVEYIQKSWHNDSCLRNIHNVNGILCSLHRYLTIAEPFCTELSKKDNKNNNDLVYTRPNYDLKSILNLLSHKDMHWMRQRAAFIFPSWVQAAKEFLQDGRQIERKKIVVFLGAFALDPKFLRNAGAGGPLGELIQWMDLITGLHVLGYDVSIPILDFDFKSAFMGDGYDSNCPGLDTKMADIFYIDVVGLNHLRVNCGERLRNKYKCTYRVLDSFGTFAEYNYANYPSYLLPGGRSKWGQNNLILTQFLTLFPHTHDNTFLGFVVTNSSNRKNVGEKKDMALLYAKKTSYLSPDSIEVLKIASTLFEIHATCVLDAYKNIFEKLNIRNHGPVSSERVQQVLSESKLFIGTGFPYEGPGPLEAMQAGTVYIQPKFLTPRSTLNSEFFRGKPNSRVLNTQNPYMQDHVGEPYCFTLDYNNKTLIREVLTRIKEMPQLPRKIPKEFKPIGMIERVYAITEKMNFCDPQADRWPPLKNLYTVVALPGHACERECLSKNLVCENSYFDVINTIPHIETFYGKQKCKNIKHVMALHAPSFDLVTDTCYLQTHGLLFSCMHQVVSNTTIQRLCPCRDYEDEQTAICKNCL